MGAIGDIKSRGIKSIAVQIRDSEPFDYGSVSEPASTFLKVQAERIQRYANKCIITIGKDLIQAKHYLSHGAFIRWVESEVGIPARTAQDYMKVAEWSADKGPSIARLPPSLLYLLCRSSTPKSFVDCILQRTEAGQNIAIADVREELRIMRATIRDPDMDNVSRAGKRKAQLRPSGLNTVWDEPLTEAVSIMARGLCAADFSRIREILMNERLLACNDLAKKIVSAFIMAERSMVGRSMVDKVGARDSNGTGFEHLRDSAEGSNIEVWQLG